MEIINENRFKEILGESKLVLIDFYADWCGPCKMMSPVIDGLAEELKNTATSLCMEKGETVDRKELLGNVLEEFWKQYERFLEVQDLSYFQKEYNEMLVNCGKEVCVLEPGKEYLATARGINELGELLVTKTDGSKAVVYAGEVSVRGIYGYV